MDGTMAVLFAIFGIGEVRDDFCPTIGCFARSDAPARITTSIARSQFNGTWLGGEVMLAYDFDHKYGPLQPTISASYSEQGEVWLGGGAKWRIKSPSNPLFLESAFQIGYHDIADGPNIGGNFHFRSDMGVGYQFDNGHAIAITYDHRSNGGIKQPNPGLETLTLEYSFTLD